MSKFIVFLIVLFSILGMADAGYLTYEKLSHQPVVCGSGFDCGTVLESTWASVGPIPLSAFGLVFYVTVWLVVVSVLAGGDFSEVGRNVAKKLHLDSKHALNYVTAPEVLTLLAIFGFLFSLYLVFLMGVVIGAWCMFCLFSAFTSSSIFVMTFLYWWARSHEPEGRDGSPIFLKSINFTIIKFLYKNILKPIFFLFDAEEVHNFMTQTGKWLGQWGWTRKLTEVFFAFRSPELVKTIDGIIFPNSVGLSAGFDYNGDLTQILPSVGFGFHTIGTVTLEPYEGNPQPRLGRFPDSKALLVNKGLKTLGAKAIIKKLEKLQRDHRKKQLASGIKKPTNAFRIPVGISIASTNRKFKNTTEQIKNIVECFQLFEKSKVGHSYYELNISCPNTFGGEPFFKPKRLARLLRAVDKLNIKKPVYIKMPIDQSKDETLEMLATIDPYDIQGVIFGNLTKDHKNPAVKPADRVKWEGKRGNLSGKPTWRRSNQLIKLTKKHYFDRFTIIGTGGVFSGKDAQKKMKLGADLVQLITGMIFEGPQVIGEIAKESVVAER